MKKNTYIFSNDKLFKLFINNAEWIALLVIILIFIISYLSNSISTERAITGTILSAIILFIIYYLLLMTYKNYSYKIIFDLKNDKITFYMLRNQGVTTKDLSDIEKIIINYRITFFVNGKKIKYQEDNIKNELSAFLDENFEVESGVFRHLPFPFK